MPSSSLFNNSDNWEAETRQSRVANTESFSSLNHASYYPNGAVRLHATEVRTTRSPSTDNEQIHRTSPDSWSSRSYSVSESRTVDSVWDQPTRTITAEDIRRDYRSLDSSPTIVSTPTEGVRYNEYYQNLWASTDVDTDLTWIPNDVFAQPTRPRITFGEL